MKGGQSGAPISSWQRALWSFLGFTLVGPFLAALAIVAVLILAPFLKLAALLPDVALPIGGVGLATFVWSAVPSALTALVLLPSIVKRSTVGATMTASAAVVAFAAANVVAPVAYPSLLTALALLAGVVALAVRRLLVAAGILLPAAEQR